MEQTIVRDSVAEFLKSLNGKFFTVEFVKRSNGEVRVMRATTNYESHLAGGSPAYNFDEKKLIPVWDLDKKGFRSIPTDSVLVIRAKGDTYKVVDHCYLCGQDGHKSNVVWVKDGKLGHCCWKCSDFHAFDPEELADGKIFEGMELWSDDNK